MKSANFSANLSLKILRNLTFFPRPIRSPGILTKQHGILLKTPGNAISETLIFKMSLDASALKNLCLLCEFQSRLLFIVSLPVLKTFLTALVTGVECNLPCVTP